MLARKALAAARAAITLLPLAMSMFGASPLLRQRSTYAIVRTQEPESHDEFDPREVVRERVVLTLPLCAADEPMRTATARFHVN